ncbi:hypothetical protein [Amycolatopsis orientalis]|uniref:hypothetical protein n=1 Tax=Amycolatopsis orientalis TaxID=31958 RepID=UPI000399DCF3|nr:hypothetical protein [Amycolatopsis orientalis]
MATLRFAFHPSAELDVPVVVPYVDDVALTELIDRFELGAGMSPAGEAYGGLVPREFSGTMTSTSTVSARRKARPRCWPAGAGTRAAGRCWRASP